ncbi:MAG: HD-GYP domain-containing protein [Desulfatibacillaceae bacterium]
MNKGVNDKTSSESSGEEIGTRPENLEQAISFLAANLMAALRNALIYSPTHTQFVSAVRNTVRRFGHAFEYTDELVFICMERELLIQERPMNRQGVHFQKLAEFMHSLGLQKLLVLPGITEQELRDFVLNLVGLPEDGGSPGKRRIKASEHIRFGHLRAGRERAPRLSHHAVVNLLASGIVSRDDIDKVKSSNREVGGEKLTRVDANLLARAQKVVGDMSSASIAEQASTRETLVNFVYYFLKQSHFYVALAPVRQHDEVTYRHSINVALLCAAQAYMLGVPEKYMFDITVAGLLHDVGKLAVPSDVLNKNGELNRTEKQLLVTHAVRGAQLLSRLQHVPPLATVAAYEHHMHFNGKGGYPQTHRCKAPHIVSQMVGLADFYDALRTDKPYRKAKSMEVTMELIKKQAGTRFHPQLAINLLKVLHAGDPLASTNAA